MSIETWLDLSTILNPAQLVKYAGLQMPQQQRLAKTIRTIEAGAVRLCFAEARSPEGEPWPALKSRRGRPLQLTGHLRTGATTGARIDVRWPKITYVVDVFY